MLENPDIACSKPIDFHLIERAVEWKPGIQSIRFRLIGILLDERAIRFFYFYTNEIIFFKIFNIKMYNGTIR